jgi:hypothetical protein
VVGRKTNTIKLVKYIAIATQILKRNWSPKALLLNFAHRRANESIIAAAAQAHLVQSVHVQLNNNNSINISISNDRRRRRRRRLLFYLSGKDDVLFA